MPLSGTYEDTTKDTVSMSWHGMLWVSFKTPSRANRMGGGPNTVETWGQPEGEIFWAHTDGSSFKLAEVIVSTIGDLSKSWIQKLQWLSEAIAGYMRYCFWNQEPAWSIGS